MKKGKKQKKRVHFSLKQPKMFVLQSRMQSENRKEKEKKTQGTNMNTAKCNTLYYNNVMVNISSEMFYLYLGYSNTKRQWVRGFGWVAALTCNGQVQPALPKSPYVPNPPLASRIICTTQEY